MHTLEVGLDESGDVKHLVEYNYPAIVGLVVDSYVRVCVVAFDCVGFGEVLLLSCT